MGDLTYETSDGMYKWSALRALFGPTILLLILTLTVPNDLLTRWPQLNDIVQAVTKIIPAMQDYINKSTVPEIAAVFFTFAWITFPIHVGLLTFEFRRQGAYSRIASYAARSGTYGIEKAILKTFAVTLLCGYGLLFLPNDPSFIGRLGMNSSRLGLAMFGSGCFFSFSMSASLFIYLFITRIGHSHE